MTFIAWVLSQALPIFSVVTVLLGWLAFHMTGERQ